MPKISIHCAGTRKPGYCPRRSRNRSAGYQTVDISGCFQGTHQKMVPDVFDRDLNPQTAGFGQHLTQRGRRALPTLIVAHLSGHDARHQQHRIGSIRSGIFQSLHQRFHRFPTDMCVGRGEGPFPMFGIADAGGDQTRLLHSVQHLLPIHVTVRFDPVETGRPNGLTLLPTHCTKPMDCRSTYHTPHNRPTPRSRSPVVLWSRRGSPGCRLSDPRSLLRPGR